MSQVPLYLLVLLFCISACMPQAAEEAVPTASATVRPQATDSGSVGLPTTLPETATPQPTAEPERTAQVVETAVMPTPSQSPGVQLQLEPVQLQSRTFVPEPGIEAAVFQLQQQTESGQSYHVLVQFFEIPTERTRTDLENDGIVLLDYVPMNSWFVSVPQQLDLKESSLRIAAWIGIIQPEDKIDPKLMPAAGEIVQLDVRAFKDSVLVDVERSLTAAGATIIETIPDFYRFSLEIQSDNIPQLAKIDSIQWITNAAPPKSGDS